MKKLAELQAGNIFVFAGYRWIKLLNKDSEETLVLMEDILEQRAFDEEDKNDWRTSDLREYLNDDFYEQLLENGANEEDFKPVISDLTSDDGLKDYGISTDTIALLTADLYRKNRNILKPLSDWWWLITPWSCLASYSCLVRFVSPSGGLNNYNAYHDDIGVRPLCNLSSEILVTIPGEEEEEKLEEKSYTELIKLWAKDKRLDTASPDKQFLKVIEEVGEIAEGMAKGRPEQIKDSIGDVYVTLVILAMQHGLGIEDCIKAAYNEIKDRKGKMIDGVFVKEEDL